MRGSLAESKRAEPVDPSRLTPWLAMAHWRRVGFIGSGIRIDRPCLAVGWGLILQPLCLRSQRNRAEPADMTASGSAPFARIRGTGRGMARFFFLESEHRWTGHTVRIAVGAPQTLPEKRAKQACHTRRLR